MAQVHGCTHKFSYLVKSYTNGNYTGRVREIPAVIAEGKNKSEVETKIQEATLHYLHRLPTEHDKALKNELKPKLITTENGFVEEIKSFEVTC